MWYVLNTCVLDDGSWKLKDTDKHPTSGGYMGHIMQDSGWIERVTKDSIPKPEVSVTRKDNKFTFEWKNPVGGQGLNGVHNSLRIYVAPEGTRVEKINEKYLAGIIQRTGHKIHEMDPLLGVQKIRRGGTERWGGSMKLPPEDNWRGQRYLPWKLRMIDYDEDYSLPHSNDNKPLTITIDNPGNKNIYAAASTWFSEESELIPLAVKQ
jgi:hypothetical protein